MAEQFPIAFAQLLRQLRTDAGLTQEELATAASVSPRSVSDIERGITLTARKDTARLLADALGLTGAEKSEFELVAVGRATPSRSLAWRAAVQLGATIAPGAAGTAGLTSPMGLAATLSSAYQAPLARPILAEGDAPAGMPLPTLAEGYEDPDFRVRQVVGDDWPSDEAWWSDVPVRSLLTEYLSGALRAPEATIAPLVVLGQPGAGKSVLTKVLAGQLSATGFVPVRVVLRETPAEGDIQDQIEYAIRTTTGLTVNWPAVAQGFGAAIPVILFDGFDELLQATGLSQSDYLARVARFQQREADQGRPLAALVTSRAAVADRARYPHGALVARLEPFRPEQITSWVERWNRLNADFLADRGLLPLPSEVVTRHQALACQPLLLLMLALYDADANALQQPGRPGPGGQPAAADTGSLDESALYEALLTSFAAREVAKDAAGLPPDEIARRVEQELQRLSLVAFAAINRQRQWVTEAELDSDLTALLGPASAAASHFRTPATHADMALGRFFFVQRAQAIRDGTRLQTFEFLHATFGEYLATRLAVQLIADLLNQRPALAVGPAVIGDDLAFALLSYAPLSSRQVLRFVQGIVACQIGDAGRRRQLAELLIQVHAGSADRVDHRYASYRPGSLGAASRQGIYSANLVLLIVTLAGHLLASQLFPASDDPPGAWHRNALLWRSALTEAVWTDLASAFTVRHTREGERRDLRIELASDPSARREPVDPYWLYMSPAGQSDDDLTRWARPYWDQIAHKMDVSCGTNDSVILHAVEPLLSYIGPTVTTFMRAGGRSSSAAHDLLTLWLSSTLGSAGDRGQDYQRCLTYLDHQPNWDAATQRRVRILFLSCLRSDASGLPASDVASYLAAAERTAGDDSGVWQLIADTAMAVASAQPGVAERAVLLALASRAAANSGRQAEAGLGNIPDVPTGSAAEAP
ncbi:MAG TPA: helix-turn-helix domain-containing protein [Streptosporangiaceae bacterium]|nr:helix-turn-helix domain-containing protein [Streptosporangiaceae bacterium]